MAGEKIKLFKGKEVSHGKESEIREKPGQSSAGKYKNLKKNQFAGPNGTYPIQDLKHARNALARAHYSPQENAIKEKVYKKYPALEERHKEREGKADNKKWNMYDSKKHR